MMVLAALVSSVSPARHLRGNNNGATARNAKSLVNTFPFNSRGGAQRDHLGGDHGDHHGGHGDHHEHHDNHVEDRFARQGSDVDVSFPAVAASAPGPDGKRCVDKVEMIEETEYDDVVQCDHSYDKRCHTTYVTNYIRYHIPI